MRFASLRAGKPSHVVIERPVPRIEHISQIDRLRLDQAGRRLVAAAQDCCRAVSMFQPPSRLDADPVEFADLVEAFEALHAGQEEFWRVWWEACGVPPAPAGDATRPRSARPAP